MGPAALGEDFIWGTTTSGTQAEGAAPSSDWARWETLGRVPTSGRGNGFATHYRDDFTLFADSGLTHHRLSLDWARLEPTEGRHDHAAVEHARAVLEAARAAGVRVWVTLHHISLPGWFGDDLGGFTDERARTYQWPKHVEWMGETFGDLVSGWVPIEDPVGYAIGSRLTGTLPPGRRNPERFPEALRDVHLANLEAARRLHGNGAPVATSMGLAPTTARPTDPDDHGALTRARDHARLADARAWGWTRVMRDGILAVPGLAEVRLDWAPGVWDLVGCSYQGAVTMDEDGRTGPYPPDGPVGPTGVVPWPDGLGIVVERLAEELPGRPLLVTGWGVATVPGRDLHQQADLVEAGLRRVAAAVDHGADVRGLFHRTGVDCYEWHHGFDVACGLFSRDREPKPAGEVARGWARP